MTETKKDVRIVIPVFNSGNTIVRCLEALRKTMNFNPSWEIIVVDNGQNPDLIPLLKNYPAIVLKKDEVHSAAYARNEGARGFLKGILVFIDSDVICEKNCIQHLVEPVKNGLCQATIGNYSKNLQGLSFSQKYKQLYIHHIYDRAGSNIKNDFWTAICSVDAGVFHSLNGFDSSFKGANGEDQEFGMRLTKNGHSVLSVKNAYGQHLNPYGIFNIIRNDLKKGLIAVKNSIDHQVPLSDNRHSKAGDILSVIFAVTTVLFSSLFLADSTLLLGIIISFSLWLLYRINLSTTFLKSGGFLFFTGALLLMFILDLIRFICVVMGVLKYKLLKKASQENAKAVPIQLKP